MFNPLYVTSSCSPEFKILISFILVKVYYGNRQEKFALAFFVISFIDFWDDKML